MKNPASGGDPSIDDYNVICDLSNNTPSTIAAGVVAAACAIKLLAIAEIVLINITAGQTVNISVQSTNQLGQLVGA
jgi:Bacteriophage tail sheath protein